jgi:hypothetical protein
MRYRVTYTRCRIDTINSPDNGHMAAVNMYRIEINIHEKQLCVMLVIYKDCAEMHGQQDIKSIQQFNIQQLYALLTLYLCVLYLSENKQRLVPLTA